MQPDQQCLSSGLTCHDARATEMMNKQIVAVEDVYVPFQRRQALDQHKVGALAESMLSNG